VGFPINVDTASIPTILKAHDLHSGKDDPAYSKLFSTTLVDWSGMTTSLYQVAFLPYALCNKGTDFWMQSLFTCGFVFEVTDNLRLVHSAVVVDELQPVLHNIP
jgi:hypothetical protein